MRHSQSLSHILASPVNTLVERMGLGQACDSKHFIDFKRQGADHPSTRAGWPVPLLRVLKHFVDVHNYFLYVVYVFVF